MFSYHYYLKWGINIFEYAGFSDFILAPFRDLIVLGLVFIGAVFSVALYYFGPSFDSRFTARYPILAKLFFMGMMPGSKGYQLIYTSILFIYPILIAHLISSTSADIKYVKMRKNDSKHRVEILSDGAEWQSYLFLGQTEHYCLVFDEKSGIVIAIGRDAGLKAIRFPADTLSK